MPVRGKDKVDENARQSWFSHQSETAKPYYYSVYLADHDVVAEMAPTDRAAVLRFTFPESDESGVVIDAFDRGSQVKVMPDSRTVVGYTTRNSGGVPDNFRNWFVIRFDKPFSGFRVFNGKNELKGFEAEGEHALAAVYFTTRRGEQVTARVASSFISEEQALRNLETEVGDADFETVKARAQERWDEVLGRIEVSGGTEEQYRTFYSCLYRSTLFPRKFYEIDAKGNPVHYSPYNGEVLPGYMYTDTGFWDTFRCLFPLLNLVYPSVNAEIQAGLANTYRESGFLPEWASPGHRGCMVGNNSASVVADAILKGVTPAEDVATLYEAMLAGRDKVHPSVSSTGRLGHEYYNTLGYVPYNVGINENAARTLEYAYDDWCIAQTAKMLGKDEDAKRLEKASQNYKNMFDPETRLMRGRNEDGTFQSPFSPYKWGDAFTEGNSWHYTWSVFHDPEGLATLMGGKTNSENARFGVRRAADLRRQLLRVPHPRDHRDAGGQHGQLRPRQPAGAAHDLPLQLRRPAVEGAVVDARGDGPPLFVEARRLLRRRGQRTDLGVVCLLGSGILSRVPGIGRVCGRLPAVPESGDPSGERPDRGDRRPAELR